MSIKRFLRYFALALTILFTLWLISITLVYFLVKTEDVKKAAIHLVNENTRGELDIGEVKLRFFPVIHFEINDLLLRSSDSFGRKEVFTCQSSRLSFNVFTLIIGRPRITLSLRNPSVNIVSDGKKNNLEDLFIESEENDRKAPSFMNYLFISKFLFDVRSADINYTAPDQSLNVEGMDLFVEVEPVTRELSISLKLPVDYESNALLASGDIDFYLHAKMLSKNDVNISVTVDATRFSADMGLFHKRRGDKLGIELLANTDLDEMLELKSLDLYLIDKFISGKGKVSSFKSPSPKVEMLFSTDSYNARNLQRISAKLRENNASGSIDSKLSLSGVLPVGDLPRNMMGILFELNANNLSLEGPDIKKTTKDAVSIILKSSLSPRALVIDDLSLNVNELKLKSSGTVEGLNKDNPSYSIRLDVPRFNVSSIVSMIPELSPYKISGLLNMNLSTSGTATPIPVFNAEARFRDDAAVSDLSLQLSNSASSRKMISARLRSNRMGLDAYIPEESRKGSKKTTGPRSTARTPVSKTGYGEILKREDVLALREAIDTFTLGLDARIDEVLLGELKISDIVLNANISKDELYFERFNFKTLKGGLISSLRLVMDPDRPRYGGNFSIVGLDVKDAASVFMPNVGGIISGKINTSMDFNTSGYSLEDIKSKLLAKGNFSFDEFLYSAEEINRMIDDALGGKIKGADNILGSDRGWETVRGSYDIKDSKINLHEFYAREGAYEAKGKGWLDFNEYMDMYVDLITPFRKIPYEPLRLNGRDSSMVSIRLTGPIIKPKFHADYLLEYLARKTLEHEKKKLQEKAKKETEQLRQDVEKAGRKFGDEIREGIRGIRF